MLRIGAAWLRTSKPFSKTETITGNVLTKITRLLGILKFLVLNSLSFQALIDAQFDRNVKFKTDINKLLVSELRLSPFGKDKAGCSYWLHTDQDLNLKIYKEDLEEEKWELIVQ